MLLSTLMIIVFLTGALVGNGLTTKAQDRRDRKHAAVQRDLNLQFRLLREQQEAAEEALRWLAKQQSGLTVVDFKGRGKPRRRR